MTTRYMIPQRRHSREFLKRELNLFVTYNSIVSHSEERDEDHSFLHSEPTTARRQKKDRFDLASLELAPSLEPAKTTTLEDPLQKSLFPHQGHIRAITQPLSTSEIA